MKKAIAVLCLFFVLSTIYILFSSPAGANDLELTVKVPAKTSDFTFSSATITSGSIFEQNKEIEFGLNYGSNLYFAADIAIVAQWSLGTIQGASTPTVDILNYVVGSAINAYGNAYPTIDTVNRRIYWAVSNFPFRTTNQTVRFKLKTNSNYTASQQVSFTVSPYMTAENLTIPSASITRYYQYHSSIVTPTPTSVLTPSSTPTPTPTPGTSASSTTTTASTPTPTPQKTTTTTTTTSNSTQTQMYPSPSPAPYFFKNIDVRTISDENAKIYVNTAMKSKITLYYGTSPGLLNRSITYDAYTLQHDGLTLQNLLPDSTYYYKVEAVDKDKKITTASDVFTLKTAAVSDQPAVVKNTIVISSSNNVLVSNSSQTPGKEGQVQPLIIPKNTNYEFKFALNKKKIKKVKVVLRRKSVLAGTSDSNQSEEEVIQEDPLSNTGGSDQNTKEVEVTEIEPGVFTGTLRSSPLPGNYDLVAVMTDEDGNITEESLTEVKVIRKFTVLAKSSGKPIEAARIYLSIYNTKNKKYEYISSSRIPVKNPSFTNAFGESDIVLPPGKYKALVSELDYKEQNIEFTIGPGGNDGFPITHLESEPFSLQGAVKYYGRTINDVFLFNTKIYIESLSQSLRFFDLITAFSFGSLVFLTLLSFSLRTHIPLAHLPRYLLFHLKKLVPKASISTHIHGTIVDASLHQPITQVDVYILDADKKMIVEKTFTNKTGEFFSKSLANGHYTVQVMKKGYEPSGAFEYPLPDGVPEKFIIPLLKSETLKQSIKENVSWAAENVIGFSFELLLIASLVFEVLSGYALGWQKVAPFLFVSLANLLLWLIYLRHVIRGWDV